MPPKTSNPEDGDPTFKFVFSVLKHCDQVKPAWEHVAKENGFAYPRNAQAKFKGIVEKNGFKFESGRIMVPGEDGVATPAGNPSGSTSVKTPKTPKTPKSAATTGKRKASAITGDVATETPTKSAAKKKKAPIKNEVEVKSEEDDDDVDANDDAGMSATADGAVKASSAKKNKKKPIAATANGNPIKKEVAGEIAGLGLEIIAEEVAKDSESDDDDDSSEIMIVGDLSA